MTDKTIGGRHSHERETAAKQWLEQLLKTKFDNNIAFGDIVKDGEVLCRCVAIIDDALIPKINEKPARSFLAKENLHFFMGACEELGVPRYLLPGVDDIYNAKNVMSVVECVESLAAIIQAQLSEGDWRLPPAALLMRSSNEGNKAQGNKVHRLVSVVNNQHLQRNPSFSLVAEKFAIPLLHLPPASSQPSSAPSTPFGKEHLKTPKGGGTLTNRSTSTTVPLTVKDLKPVSPRQDGSNKNQKEENTTTPERASTPLSDHKERTTESNETAPQRVASATVDTVASTKTEETPLFVAVTPSMPSLEALDDLKREDIISSDSERELKPTTDDEVVLTRPRSPRSARISPRPMEVSPRPAEQPSIAVQSSPSPEKKAVTPRAIEEGLATDSIIPSTSPPIEKVQETPDVEATGTSSIEKSEDSVVLEEPPKTEELKSEPTSISEPATPVVPDPVTEIPVTKVPTPTLVAEVAVTKVPTPTPLETEIPVTKVPTPTSPAAEEKKEEADLTTEKHSEATSTAPTREEITVPGSGLTVLKWSDKDVRSIILIQSLVRGRIGRRHYGLLVRANAYRARVAREILETEKVYVDSLKTVVKLFLRPLKNACRHPDGLVNEKQCKQIFSNIEVILNYNTKLLVDLEKRVHQWSHQQLLGDIFLMITHFLKTYTEYVTNYDTAIQTLRECRSDPRFIKFLDEISHHPEVQKQQLSSFLIKPIQRIPRYEMLLNDLVKHTQKDHPDYKNLASAAVRIHEVAVYVEAKKNEAEAVCKVLEVQSRIGGKCPNFVTPTRRFIREGVLMNDKKKEMMFFLFNDVLVVSKIAGKTKKSGLFTRQKAKDDLPYTFHAQYPLVKHRIEIVDKEVSSFALYDIEKKDIALRLFASSAEEKTSWINDLSKLGDKARNPDPGTLEPLQVPNGSIRERNQQPKINLTTIPGFGGSSSHLSVPISPRPVAAVHYDGAGAGSKDSWGKSSGKMEKVAQLLRGTSSTKNTDQHGTIKGESQSTNSSPPISANPPPSPRTTQNTSSSI
eukprot:TRINITY_DN1390_c0_g1_i1.p1 TRINITY_DN1390_c0_g1~~TRINITY_DN1390_c0_g1_i1.p1  ORF type:complete len:1021 (+),score=227.99 TRINITY_DN1390_c0_g1_i1:133-3195(+)